MKNLTGLIVMVFWLLSGCQSNGAEKPMASACPGLEGSDGSSAAGVSRVRLLEQPDVTVVDMRCVMRNELLRIDVDIRNDRPREQNISYRFEWFDADAMSLDGDDAWKPVRLYPDELRTIRTVSPSPIARHFVLVIKR